MKKTYLNSFCARFLTLLVLALLSTNLAWGKTWTYTVTKESSPTLNSDNPATVNEALWSIVMGEKVGSPSVNGTPVNAQKSSGWQWGNGKSDYWKSYTLSTDYFKDKNVKSVKVNFMNNGSKSGTMTVTQGSTTIGFEKQTFGQVWTDLTANTTTGTGGKLSITYTVDQASYIHSITVEYEEATTPTVAYTVTFDAGENGTCSTPSLTEASVGAGVTLPECTPNDYYNFIGWSTTVNGTTADAGVAGDTYKPSENCTLYAVYKAYYILHITQPTDGGTLTVKDGDTELAEDAHVNVGTNLTCEVTGIPEGKRFSRFYANWDNSQSKYKETNPATFDNIATENITECTISVTYKELEKYTINYYVNGVNTPQEVYEGTALVFPNVDGIAGKVFRGWVEEAIDGTTDTKPTFVTTTGLTATADKNYYAVFANKEGEDKYVKVTSALTDWRGDYLVAYSDEVFMDGSLEGGTGGVGKQSTSVNPEDALSDDKNTITATWGDEHYVTIEAINDDDLSAGYVIKSHSATTPYFYHTNNTGNGMSGTDNKSTAATYPITITFNNENDIDIALGGSATGAVLHWNNQAIGSGGQVFRYYKNGGQENIYLYKKQEATYSDYCTYVNKSVTISSAGWATVCLPFKSTITSGDATAYYVIGINEKALVKTEASVIPAGEGILLKSNNGGEATVTFTISAEDATDATGNMMKGAITETTFDESGYKYYILANGDNGLGFYYQGTENDGSTVKCAAGKAVLAVPTTSGAKAFFSLDNEPTGIESLTPALSEGKGVYNLNGLKVNEAYKGIVIMNGKKYINK